MLSYMSIDRIEGNFAVCEVEETPIASRAKEFWKDPCFMADVPTAMFTSKGLPVVEGMVYKVIHNGKAVTQVCEVDETEQNRRLKILEELF